MSGVLIASGRARFESHAILVVPAEEKTTAGDDLAREQRGRVVQDDQVHRAIGRRLESLAQEVEHARGRDPIEPPLGNTYF